VASWLDMICVGVTPAAEVDRLVGKYMTAFLRTNLLAEHDCRHRAHLRICLTQEPLIEFFVTEKRNFQAIKDDWPDSFMLLQAPTRNRSGPGGDGPRAALPVYRVAMAAAPATVPGPAAEADMKPSAGPGSQGGARFTNLTTVLRGRGW